MRGNEQRAMSNEWAPRLRRHAWIGVLLLTSLVWAINPAELRETDVLSNALFHTEPFQGQMAHVPTPPATAREQLLQLISAHPDNPAVYRALADIQVQLQDIPGAENSMRQFVAKSSDKDAAYGQLEQFYASRLLFDMERKALEEHAAALKPAPSDVPAKSGRYLIYRQTIDLIAGYGLPIATPQYYTKMIESYPNSDAVYLEAADYMKRMGDTKGAEAILEQFHSKFPDKQLVYLKTRAELIPSDQAFRLLSDSYDPLWDIELVRTMDRYAKAAGKQEEYLAGLKGRLQKNALDFDAVTRLYHAFHIAGDDAEAQNVLYDFRLLKEQKQSSASSPSAGRRASASGRQAGTPAATGSSSGAWTPRELLVMARLNQIGLNFNESARYYYALYQAVRAPQKGNGPTGDDALYGLFQVLLSADQRPVQIGSGNLDYYKDIAAMDRNPGVLNGILSLILNGTNPASEFQDQQTNALGYFNRAQSFRLLQLVQKQYPQSPHLPAMYRGSLKVYEKYKLDQLLVQTGEQFFKSYPNSDEVIDVGVAVIDACTRMNDHENEWKTYRFLLPIAAARQNGRLSSSPQQASGSDEGDDEESPQPDSTAQQQEQTVTYDQLLKRYISSLTQQKQNMEVVKLYRDQIVQHPDQEKLYEDFLDYLEQNQLSKEAEEVYQAAIVKFQEKSWYERLARWYLRKKRIEDFDKLSRQIVDLFSATDVSAFLSENVGSANPYRKLYVGLNKYAHERFPFNTQFVRNLLGVYSSPKSENWPEWTALSLQYYYLDEEIRTGYLRRISHLGSMPAGYKPSNAIEQRLAGDIQVWRSHFEEAVPYYEQLTATQTSDRQLNVLVADLKRSLGVEKPDNYEISAGIRERLASIEPSDSSLWTTAGETLADVELYDRAKADWQKILLIDPLNPERYLEVATILWDYYLFDDALAVINRIREIRNEPSLYAYEAGAIQEGKRNYEEAVAEYSRSLVSESELAQSRLGQLYKRPTLQPVIRRHLKQMLDENDQDTDWWMGIIRFYNEQKEKEDVRRLIASAMKTLGKEQFEYRAEQLKQVARDAGFYDLQEQLIQLQSSRAATPRLRLDIQLELARFYEAHDAAGKAEAVYTELYRQQPRVVGVINELISFYWRSRQYPKAFEIYDQTIAAANANYRKTYLLEAAHRYRERGVLDKALADASLLLKENPMDAGYFQLVAEILAEQKNFPALTEHYKTGLQQIRDAKLPEDEKRSRTEALRRGIIQADLILKDYPSALDQYIEILNRNAESETLIQEMSEFAAQHSLIPRLVTYYQQTATTSPKDHRWPMVLGRIELYAGDFDAALKDFQAAIAIRPERTDFYQTVAETYQRMGRYRDALNTYQQLYTMTYKDSRWLDPIAELQARLGETGPAMETYTRTLTGVTEIEKNALLCRKALSWGKPDQAAGFGEKALQDYYGDMSQDLGSEALPCYLEATVRNGDAAKALDAARDARDRVVKAQTDATFDAEQLRSASYIVKQTLTETLPDLFKTYLPGDRMEAMETAVFRKQISYDDKSDVYLPMARRAGMTPAEERLLRELAAESIQMEDQGKYRSWRDQLRNFYMQRGAFARCGDWLHEQWKLNHTDEHRDDLVQVADAYRLAGQPEQELQALREYYAMAPQNSLQAPAVERYLTLLYNGNAKDELRRAAASADLTAANFFIRKHDRELATLAIGSLARGKDPVWKTINHAMLGRELADSDPFFDQQFHAGLDIRPIGEQVSQPADEKTSLTGDDWFYYGTRYGQYLWEIKQTATAAFYLNSDIEGASTNSQRQDELGNFYFEKAKDYPSALDHYTLALQLQPQSATYMNDRARALAETGNKTEAMAAWKSMLDLHTAAAYQLYLESAKEYEFLDQAREPIESYLQAQIPKAGASTVTDLVAAYAWAVPEDALPGLVKKWVTASSYPLDFGRELINSYFPEPGKLAAYAAVTEYLNAQVASSAGTELEGAEYNWLRWSKEYARALMRQNKYAAAAQVVSSVLNHYPEKEGATPQPSGLSEGHRRDLLLLKAEALVSGHERDAAMEVLDRYLAVQPGQPPEQERYTKAAELLREHGYPADATALLEKLYRGLLAAGNTEATTYVGLAEALLDEKKVDDAKEQMRRMIYLQGENLEGFGSAAELMEKHQQPQVAAEYRAEWNKRIPWEMANSALLADDLLKTGRKDQAAQLASRVLKSDLSTLEDRVIAAKVYGAAAGTGEAGASAEILAIQRYVRSGTPGESPGPPYYVNLRRIILEKIENPPLQALLSQRFMTPEDQGVEIQLFAGLAAAGKCDAALYTIDPHDMRTGTYAGGGEESENEEYEGEDYEYDSYSSSSSANNPIEGMSLTDARTFALARQAADCAARTEDFNGQIYFLEMAAAHAPENEKAGLQKTIDQLRTENSERQDKESGRFQVADNLGRRES